MFSRVERFLMQRLHKHPANKCGCAERQLIARAGKCLPQATNAIFLN